MLLKAKLLRTEPVIEKNNFKRQDVIVETIAEKKPQILRFECYGETIAHMNAMLGQECIIDFWISGHENKETKKVWNNLVAFKFKPITSEEAK